MPLLVGPPAAQLRTNIVYIAVSLAMSAWARPGSWGVFGLRPS
ncbi:hypothetical protein AIOL_001189 [Candidatus Rhodobacter oscarellae]|uniref:Uncharacterized protein n=1 Tax=Candidatus Rhodobacter oscarellae TaxID=1675527 RepID=A0A0J9E0Q5_9RHOB|nr:hypothetical protein [Candidatus Rhodobacter lobularis]KMW56237.1 hypothetical protein AIOL_001189 [Candidatus Rhodobacter lobularis]